MNVQKLTTQIESTNKVHCLAPDYCCSIAGERLGTKTHVSHCLSGMVGWVRELRTFGIWHGEQGKDVCSETWNGVTPWWKVSRQVSHT